MPFYHEAVQGDMIHNAGKPPGKEGAAPDGGYSSSISFGRVLEHPHVARDQQEQEVGSDERVGRPFESLLSIASNGTGEM